MEKFPSLDSSFLQKRAEHIVKDISPYLNGPKNIVDIGSGGAHIVYELEKRGHPVTAVDVRDTSAFKDITPVIYDGATLPFSDNSFDTALLITVLHHTKDPVGILKEASRVAKEVIVIEDIYESRIQKYLTYVMDSALNFEFFGHPHSNKSESEWAACFSALGLNVAEKRTYTFWKFFLTGIFHLKRANQMYEKIP